MISIPLQEQHLIVEMNFHSTLLFHSLPDFVAIIPVEVIRQFLLVIHPSSFYRLWETQGLVCEGLHGLLH